ncbi:hypothetical protein G8759_06290 [Spirosoma aureum]|uniref:Uncharacterized protein n=1 Tax=Spirosoma aureum TaxID=2692134 RepID=A0A6G9AJA5_9BACT|nr:hypothetical protein [Spirosoma aureum]QIP12263.1 hypothetical protein G8759_06290 [Spirosoma aureum]
MVKKNIRFLQSYRVLPASASELVFKLMVPGNLQLTTDTTGNPVPEEKQIARGDAPLEFRTNV